MRRLHRHGPQSRQRRLNRPGHWLETGVAAFVAFGMLSLSAQAQSFSAGLVTTDQAGAAVGKPGKLYVGESKVRIEIPEIEGIFVVDPVNETSLLVRPARKMFMDAKQSTPLTQLFVHVDPADPCPQWQAMAVIAGAADKGGAWRCERLGEDTLDGRATVKYRAVSPRGQTHLGWIDSSLKFLLKITNDDGTAINVKIVEEGPQPESLFIFPAKYGKFDPKQLLEQVKRSDAWVPPPQ